MPILTALAERKAFRDQPAELRSSGEKFLIAGAPLIDGEGRFAGFRGSAAAAASAPKADTARRPIR